MYTYVSFLRGINVGGRTVKMADLKYCYEKAGFFSISTLLQSGNVVFKTEVSDISLIRARLEAAVSSRFNYPAKIAVVKQKELPAIVNQYPFDSADERYQHYIIFLLRPELATSLIRSAMDLDPKLEQIAKGPAVVYWKVEKGLTLKSPFAKVLNNVQFKDFHTVRNIKTVKKFMV